MADESGANSIGQLDIFEASDSDGTSDGEDLEIAVDESVSALYSGRHDPNKDPTASQRFEKRDTNDLKNKEVPAIHDTSWLYERVVEDYAEYATKEGADFDVTAKDAEETGVTEDQAIKVYDDLEDRIDEDAKEVLVDYLETAVDSEGDTRPISEEEAERIEDRMREWTEENDVFPTMQDLIEEERATGTGAVVFRTAERGPNSRTLRDPVTNPVRIEAMNVIGEQEMSDLVPDLDPLSMTYKEMKRIDVLRQYSAKVESDDSNGDINDARLHPDRFVALRTRWSKLDPKWGVSVFRRLRTIMQVFMNAEWAVGQIVWRLIFKVLKMDLDGFDDSTQKRVAEKMIAQELDALSLTILGKDDELSFESPLEGVSGIGELWDMMKELLSTSLSTPKSILFGQQQGEVSGADLDLKNYFQGIEASQESDFTRPLRKIVDYGLRCEEEIVLPNSIHHSDVEYSIHWNEIFGLDEKEKATVENTRAKTEEIKQRIVNQLTARGLMQKEEAAEVIEELEFIDTATPGAAPIGESFRRSQTGGPSFGGGPGQP